MQINVWKSTRRADGFTLIELMVAVLIMTIGLLGILDVMINYTRINLDNVMRDEAMRITEETMESLRTAGFDVLAASTSTVTRKVRSMDVPYTVTTNVRNLSGQSKEIWVEVTWTFKGRTHVHRAPSAISLGLS